MIPEPLSPLANHLWQSTLFAGVAGLLTLALRRNHARARYWLWMTASVKFLIPLSLLVALGSRIEWRTAPAATHQFGLPAVMEEVSQPFATSATSPFLANVPPAPSPLPAILLSVWGCGFIGVAFQWWIDWRRVRATVRAGLRLPLDFGIPAVSSPALLEPSVFGIFRPVLLLPEGIAERLTPAQLEAIVAHEFCHVRSRDNLGAAVHMLVEAIFWFHPLVWWIRTRLVEERERACDEEVLRLGNEPRVYALSILKVCELCLESPAVCVAGVTGANLKRRIEAILKNRSALRLNFGKKLLLAAAGMLVASAPLIVGLAKAQTKASPTFEVASLKEVVDGSGPAPLSLTPRRTAGKLTWTSPLGILVGYAYHLPLWRISGIDTQAPIFCTIAATMDAHATEDQVRLMLQTLLIDRFKIVSHRETKEFSGYALVVAKNGSKLKTATASGETPPMPDYFHPPSAAWEGRIFTSEHGAGISAITGRGVSTSQLADELSEDLGAYVWDQTGMTGKYYFGFKFLSVKRPSDTADAPSIFSVVQDELGLRLEKRKGPVEILVVDHYQKKPSEN